MDADAHRDHPFAPVYDELSVPVLSAGDVSSRFTARLLRADAGVFTAALDPRAGPRHGTLSRVNVVDPSFFNWPALRVALAGDTIVPDFRLANKSFNLSYAGNDL